MPRYPLRVVRLATNSHPARCHVCRVWLEPGDGRITRPEGGPVVSCPPCAGIAPAPGERPRVSVVAGKGGGIEIRQCGAGVSHSRRVDFLVAAREAGAWFDGEAHGVGPARAGEVVRALTAAGYYVVVDAAVTMPKAAAS